MTKKKPPKPHFEFIQRHANHLTPQEIDAEEERIWQFLDLLFELARERRLAKRDHLDSTNSIAKGRFNKH